MKTVEQQIIGYAVEKQLLEHILSRGITPEHLNDPLMRELFTEVIDISKAVDNLDLLSVGGVLIDRNKRNLMIALTDCCTDNPFTLNIDAFIDEIHTDRSLRKAALELNQITKDIMAREAFDSKDYIGLVTAVLEKIDTRVVDKTKSLSGRDLWASVGDHLDFISEKKDDESLKPISTGIKLLDDAFGGGWKKGRMYALGARSSMGKTTLACNFVSEALSQDKRVAMFTVEMDHKDICNKILSLRSKVNGLKFDNGQFEGKEVHTVMDEFMKLTKTHLSVNDKTRNDFEKFKIEARRLKRTEGLDFLVFDYIQQLNISSAVETRVREMTRITGEIQSLAKELDIPILCLAQLNRAAETECPGMHHLKESGSIEQDCDGVVLLHMERDGDNQRMLMTIAKNRHGARDRFEIGFCRETNWFGDHKKNFL